jgi:hypothetical protein
MDILGGVLLVCGGVVMAFHELFLNHRLHWETRTPTKVRCFKVLCSPTTALAARAGLYITALYSIYYWVYHFGWIAGLTSWAGIALLASFVCRFLLGVYSFVLISGFVFLGAGYYIALDVLRTFPESNLL